MQSHEPTEEFSQRSWLAANSHVCHAPAYIVCRLARCHVQRKSQYGAKPLSVLVPSPQSWREPPFQTRHLSVGEAGCARPNQEVVRGQAQLREAATLSINREKERCVPRLRRRSCASAGVRWRGRSQQHAMANRRGWQGERQDRRSLSLILNREVQRGKEEERRNNPVICRLALEVRPTQYRPCPCVLNL
jgi:hypothetical protein